MFGWSGFWTPNRLDREVSREIEVDQVLGLI
jgi:hypothetical protein